MTRAEILRSVLGRPWVANARGPEAFDCYHLFAHLQRELFGRDVMDAIVKDGASYQEMMAAVSVHPERRRWKEILPDALGIVRPRDGAAVLMGRVMLGRREHLAHVGTWLEPERRIIHADQDHGVVADMQSILNMRGWLKVRFYECTEH